MAFRAVRFCLLRLSASSATLCQSFFEHAALRVQHFIEGQSSCGSLDDGICLKTGLVSKFYCFVCSAIDGHKPAPAKVSLLLGAGRPLAIGWFVISVYIDSIKRVVVGAWTHVIDEIGKHLPTLAHANSSTPVVTPLLEIGVATTAKHALPYLVKRVWVLKRHR